MTIKKRAPSGVVDVLRLLVVVFFAGLGYEVSKRFNSGAFVLGPLNGVMVGIIIGSGLGYVLGGVLGRTTVTVVGRTEHSLRQASAEELVAGSFGGVIGVLVGAGVAWWIFLLLQPFLAFPLFGFVVAVIGYLGYRLGTSRREEMLSMFASRAGMGPRPQARSNLPRIVDTSVAIDGRILDVVRAGFLDGTFLIPSPVLAELQRPRRFGRRPASCEGTSRAAESRSAQARARGQPRGARRRTAGSARGRRQTGADLSRPRPPAADPRHQLGQGRDAGRRPRHESARARPRAAPAGLRGRRRRRPSASSWQGSGPGRRATSTTARWSWPSVLAITSVTRSRSTSPAC